MERRTLVAIGLMLMVALLPSILFPPEPPAPGAEGPDSAAASDDTVIPAGAEVPTAPPTVRPRVDVLPVPGQTVTEGPAARTARDVVVESPLYRLVFSTQGARLVGAYLEDYRTFAPGASGPAQLVPDASTFLAYAMVVGNDTIPLADWAFEPSRELTTVDNGSATLEWIGRRGALEVRVTYTFYATSHVFDVEGSIGGGGSDVSGVLLVGLGPRIAPVEADSVDDSRSFAVVTKAGKTGNLKFSSLDPFERRALDGPFEWVAIRSKYFVIAVLSVAEGTPRFGGAIATGGPRFGRQATNIDVITTLPAANGSFRFSVYAGPQNYRRLSAVGHDFQDIKPYGGFLRPIIRPFANFIVVVLLWMHETLTLEYGWVLVLFGIAVRVVLWPLNQKAMRSSMAMQALQPEIKALQERHKGDAQRLQQEMMKLYKEHKVNPLGGCLPLLIPMPVLFALFFVFRETIEFRGVPFLWLPDLSRADPLYIIPIVMGLSMFAVMKLGQRGIPPNPQAKMMLYMMPGILTFVFLKLSSGLNLYYAVSNIASIPQQWLIAKERQRKRKTAMT